MGLIRTHTTAGAEARYRQASAYLEGLQFFRIKLGLATMTRLLQELGQPQRRLRCIHIAGTNGKGSVGATLSTLLSRGGYCSGFYSSPHLVEVRERFTIDGRPIPQEEFSDQMAILQELSRRTGLQPTYFECTTLLALNWFAARKVDVAILETGLGGRLDATNVVDPMVSVITDISRDHEQYLGTDIRAIAAEKAGIVKAGVPVVCSGRTGASAEVIASFCHKLGSRLLLFGRDFSARGEKGRFDYSGIHGAQWRDLPLALAGAHQVVNTALALATLELVAADFPLDVETIRAGLARVCWPGRMEYLHLACGQGRRRILLEGAHNEAGVQALCASLEALEPGRRIVLLWGNMADKHLSAARSRLFAAAERIFLTRVDGERSAAPGAIWQELSPEERGRARCLDCAEEALQAALDAAGEEDLVCVAGSLYLVGRIRHALEDRIAKP